LHMLITAGPTQENIDPVRYITNHSSGKMGFALAEAAAEAGARVTLVAGPVFLPPPDRVQRIDVVSARDMLAACEAAMPCDLFVAAAAVADYRPEVIAPHKLKKDPTTGDGLLLQMVRNPDILATLAGRPDRPFSVGFAAETENLLQYATRKLRDKNVDLIVANDVANARTGPPASASPPRPTTRSSMQPARCACRACTSSLQTMWPTPASASTATRSRPTKSTASSTKPPSARPASTISPASWSPSSPTV